MKIKLTLKSMHKDKTTKTKSNIDRLLYPKKLKSASVENTLSVTSELAIFVYTNTFFKVCSLAKK